MWSAIISLTVLLLIQGLVYPSNSTDALMYHLPRVVSWIGQRSVEHFPSHNYSQVYMPPFAEYLVMNVNILYGGDRWCNTVQWLFLTACGVAVSRLSDLLLSWRKDSSGAHLLTVCLPVAVLQSSTANNDIVVSFFLLTSFLYGYRWIRQQRLTDGFWLGASFGLACLTKATAYLYLGPLVAWMSVVALSRIPKEGVRPLARAIVPTLVFASILINMYARNLDLTGNPLGIDRGNSETGVNGEFTLRAAFSNLFKNLGRQMGPYPLNVLYDSALYKAHRTLDIPIKIQGTHFYDMEYRGAPNLPIHDSTAPNSLYICLLLSALAWMLLRRTVWKEKSPSALVLHSTILISQLVLFSAFLKWQPWHTRLLMPLCFLSVPIVCHALSRYRPPKAWKTIGLCMVFGTALFAALFNDARPFLSTPFTQELSIRDGRFDKYFTDRFKPFQEEMERIKGVLDSANAANVGLVIDAQIPEYILFHDAYERKSRPVHLDVSNISGRLGKNRAPVDCIVTNTVSDSLMSRNGRIYRNMTPDHGRLWIFQ